MLPQHIQHVNLRWVCNRVSSPKQGSRSETIIHTDKAFTLLLPETLRSFYLGHFALVHSNPQCALAKEKSKDRINRLQIFFQEYIHIMSKDNPKLLLYYPRTSGLITRLIQQSMPTSHEKDLGCNIHFTLFFSCLKLIFSSLYPYWIFGWCY